MDSKQENQLMTSQLISESISGLTADDSVLVLADIVGGSPLTTAATVLEEAESSMEP